MTSVETGNDQYLQGYRYLFNLIFVINGHLVVISTMAERRAMQKMLDCALSKAERLPQSLDALAFPEQALDDRFKSSFNESLYRALVSLESGKFENCLLSWENYMTFLSKNLEQLDRQSCFRAASLVLELLVDVHSRLQQPKNLLQSSSLFADIILLKTSLQT